MSKNFKYYLIAFFLGAGVYALGFYLIRSRSETKVSIPAFDSVAYIQNRLDSALSDAKEKEHEIWLKSKRIDLSIKNKYEKSFIIYNPDSLDYALRLRLLSELDSEEFTY